MTTTDHPTTPPRKDLTMACTTVKTQQELDAALTGEATCIHIESEAGVWLTVRGNASVEAWDNASVVAWDNASVVARGNASVVAWDNASVVARGNASVVARGNASVVARGNASVVARGNASVVARGNASVVAWDNASVVARGNASVVAWDNASVEARGNASVVARGNASVEAWDNASVEAWGNASVEAWGNASVVARGNASVVAWDNASVVAWGNASVEAWGNASVVAWDNASVVAWDNASVEARDNASVEAWDNASVEAWDNASVEARATTAVRAYSGTINAGPHVAVHLHNAQATVNGGVVIDVTQLDLTDPRTWCEHHGITIRDDRAVLFKALGDDLTTGVEWGRITVWPVGGEVTAGDWRDDTSCGGGLHFSPHPRQARQYASGATRYLRVSVALADLRPIPGGVPKCKAPSAVVEAEVSVRGVDLPAAEAVPEPAR